jgi:hypothetical protein
MDTQVQLMSKQAPLTATEFVAMHNVPYHKAVSVLNWAMLATCPDITFANTTVACFSANPRPAHWQAIKQILHYLAGTQDLWLSYGETRCILEGYCHRQVAVSRQFQIRFEFLTSVQLVPLRTYCLKRLSRGIT